MPEKAIWLTVDVSGLYPSIPHEESLEALRESLEKRECLKIPTDTLD